VSPGRRRGSVPGPAPASPLRELAEDLLVRMGRKHRTRGDIEAVIQTSTSEILEALSRELCSESCGMPCTSDCGADELWLAWGRVRPRLWGDLA
jgi:hypothetical protein